LGAGQWRGTPATVWRNVVPTFIYKALHALPLPVENEGVATRDFIYVDDVCLGLIACALRGKAGDVYNIASGKETSVRALASLINEITRNEAPIAYLPRRDWDHAGRRFGSTEKAQRELDFQAQVVLRTGLSKTVEWTQKHLSLIQQCMDQHRSHMS
jgi:nucleoside-diphosphate-sugar epimerase